MPRRRPPAPVTGRWPVATGMAEIMLDDDRPGAWVLFVDGVAQSSVHLEDPTVVPFDYVRTLADLVDVMRPAGAPVEAVHLGGGGLTLPRYLAATRPLSRQLVIEVDGPLADLVRERFGVPPGVRVRIGDARIEIGTLHPGRAGLVVDDAFVAGAAPPWLGGIEGLDAVVRALAPDGVYAANISARAGAVEAWRRRLAVLQEAFPYVLAAGPGRVLKGRRDGNVVAVASRVPLPTEALRTRLASRAQPVSLLEEDGRA